MYIEIEVIELDAVNDVKTGPVFRILRGLIEMIVFKEPTLMLSLSLSIPEQYNIFIPGDNIVAYKLDELLQNIISQLILDTDSDSSDTDYDGFDNDVSQSGTQTDVSLSNSDPDSSQSQESVDLFTYIGKKYPKYPLPTEPAMVTEDVIEDLNKQNILGLFPILFFPNQTLSYTLSQADFVEHDRLYIHKENESHPQLSLHHIIDTL
jgi:hypothetical protein